MAGSSGKTPQQLLNDARAAGPKVHTPSPALQPGRSSRPILPQQPVAPIASRATPAPTPSVARPTPAFKAAARKSPVQPFNNATGTPTPTAKHAFARAAAQGMHPPAQGLSKDLSRTRKR